MIINGQHPNLSKADNDILKIDAMIEHSLKIFRVVAANRYKESKPPRKMIGALDKKDYVAPENDKWRHNDSQSDDEEPKLKKMMEDKFGRKKINIFSGDSGDAGATAAAGAHGASSAGGDEEDSDSDDNHPKPGYEFYLDDRGVRKMKQTAARRKSKSRKYISALSVQPIVLQQEPVHEAEMNPNFGLTSDEAAAIISSPPRSSEPPPAVTLATETPIVAPQEPARTMASTIRATTSQHSSEHRQRIFSEMQPDETIEQLKAKNARLKAVDEVREWELLQMRAADNAHGIEMNRLKERSTKVQRIADSLKAKHDYMRQWYNSRNTTLTEGFKNIKDNVKLCAKRVNIMWYERCKQIEILRKHDQDKEDLGNPDTSESSQQGASESTQIIVYKPQQTAITQGTSDGAQEELPQLESNHYVESSSAGKDPVVESADLALKRVHPVTGEELEEGELIADFTDEQIVALNEMKAIEDAAIDQIPSEPETTDLENLEEIVF
ncbi:hypothetical protein Hanom_Chr03g00225901 [Helianthus anomalus]